MRLLLSILFLSQALALDKEWWKHSTIYEIFTPSYKDSNGDGWGDLKGITSKLDYLKDLGVDTLYLTPFYPSPMLDMGYDVSDYYAIHPKMGTMTDFHEFIQELNKRDMKLIMDLVINHSSDQHQWFEKSVAKIHPYTDYYVWRDPAGYDNNSSPIEPNNWCTIMYTSAWTWNEKRKQFYYHVFLPQQPELNYRNPLVLKEMKKIIKFWLDKGVSGLRIDAVPQIMEDQSFEDEEPIDEKDKGKKVDCWHSKRTKTRHVNDSFHFIRQLRSHMNKINSKENKFERIIILEAFGEKKDLIGYNGNVTHPGGHFTFNYNFDYQFEYQSPINISSTIDYWLEITPNNSALNWLVGCHDRFRASFKYIQEYVNVLFTLISTLPGIMSLYYGEEIGMTSGIVRPNQRRKFYSDFARTPMQWDGSPNGGFSSNSKTWLPVNPNFWKVNVKDEQLDQNSVYHFIKSLLSLRKKDVMLYGDFEKFIPSEWVLIIIRSFKGQKYIVVLNLGTEKEEIRLDRQVPNRPVLRVHISTPNSGLKKGTIVTRKKKQSFVMEPMSAVVLSPKKL